jgi:glucose uptake protein GlcU
MQKKNTKTDPAAGTFGIIFGSLCLALAIWVLAFKSIKSGTAWGCAYCGLMLLWWGIGQVQAARRIKKQDSDDTKQADHRDAA